MADNNWFNRLVEALGSVENALQHCYSVSLVDIIAARDFKPMQRLTRYLKDNNQSNAIKRLNFSLKAFGLTTAKVNDNLQLQQALTNAEEQAINAGFDVEKFANKPVHVKQALAVRFLYEQGTKFLAVSVQTEKRNTTLEERALKQAQTLLKTLDKFPVNDFMNLRNELHKLVEALSPAKDNMENVWNEQL